MWNEKNTHTHKRVKEYYTIGEVKKMYGFGADSLRYFERKGLLQPRRGDNQYRYYSGKELWALNVIKNLRSINLSVDRICQYLKNRTLSTTLDMLRESLDFMTERIRLMQLWSESIRTQIRIIEESGEALFDVVTAVRLPERRCYILYESYVYDEDYDLMRKELTQLTNQPFWVIGDNRVGSATSLQRIRENDFRTYDCMFVFDDNGPSTIPGGNYLTIRYRGRIDNEKYVRRLLEYAERNEITIRGPFIELIWLDVHTTDVSEEWVTEIQVEVEL